MPRLTRYVAALVTAALSGAILLVTSPLAIAAPACLYDKILESTLGKDVAASSFAACQRRVAASSGGGMDSRPEGTGGRAEAPAPTQAEIAEKYRQQLMAFHARLATWQECVGSSIAYGSGGQRFDQSGVEMVCGGAPIAPPTLGPDGANAAREATAAMPVEQLAYLAAARLTLPDLTLGMGPDPTVNRWNKAFVGVEYWFWAKGSTSVAPVGQTVGPVSVRLTASVEKLTVKTGGSDSSVACDGAGTAWRDGTDLQTPSPSCGQQFTTIGERRIVLTATWAVEWTINGQSGVIRLQRSSARDIEVSELHAVTR